MGAGGHFRKPSISDGLRRGILPAVPKDLFRPPTRSLRLNWICPRDALEMQGSDDSQNSIILKTTLVLTCWSVASWNLDGNTVKADRFGKRHELMGSASKRVCIQIDQKGS